MNQGESSVPEGGGGSVAAPAPGAWRSLWRWLGGFGAILLLIIALAIALTFGGLRRVPPPSLGLMGGVVVVGLAWAWLSRRACLDAWLHVLAGAGAVLGVVALEDRAWHGVALAVIQTMAAICVFARGERLPTWMADLAEIAAVGSALGYGALGFVYQVVPLTVWVCVAAMLVVGVRVVRRRHELALPPLRLDLVLVALTMALAAAWLARPQVEVAGRIVADALERLQDRGAVVVADPQRLPSIAVAADPYDAVGRWGTDRPTALVEVFLRIGVADCAAQIEPLSDLIAQADRLGIEVRLVILPGITTEGRLRAAACYQAMRAAPASWRQAVQHAWDIKASEDIKAAEEALGHVDRLVMRALGRGVLRAPSVVVERAGSATVYPTVAAAIVGLHQAPTTTHP